MPNINESEISDENEYFICVQCNLYAGDVWLCGVGMICTKCISDAASVPEEMVLSEDEISDEIKNRAKIGLANARE